MVGKYKMQERYVVTRGPQPNTLVLQSKVRKSLPVGSEKISTNSASLTGRRSASQPRLCQTARMRELEETRLPRDLKAYLRKYVRSDLKQLGVSVSMLDDTNKSEQPPEENKAGLAISKYTSESIIHSNDIKKLAMGSLTSRESVSPPGKCLAIRPGGGRRVCKSGLGRYDSKPSAVISSAATLGDKDASEGLRSYRKVYALALSTSNDNVNDSKTLTQRTCTFPTKSPRQIVPSQSLARHESAPRTKARHVAVLVSFATCDSGRKVGARPRRAAETVALSFWEG